MDVIVSYNPSTNNWKLINGDSRVIIPSWARDFLIKENKKNDRSMKNEMS